MACAKLAMIGTASVIVAVFEATSVKPVMKATVLITMTSCSAAPRIAASWPAI